MIKENSKTKFASPQRSNEKELQKDQVNITSEENLKEIFNSIDSLSFIINSNRQIVYANSYFAEFLGLIDFQKFLGQRQGELMGCIYSNTEPMGCGTSESCKYCGAVQAVLECQKTNKKSENECRITSSINGELVNFELKVTAYPMEIKNNKYIVITMKDISDEKRKKILERIFFHDIIDLAGGLNGALTLINQTEDKNEYKDLLESAEKASSGLIDEIDSYKQIVSAERGDLEVKIKEINTVELLKNCIQKINYHEVAKNKIINIDENTINLNFKTDETILSRILINMLKNALEESKDGDTIKAGSALENDNTLRIWVKNNSIIPKKIQNQIFQRSFSTKSINRGLGTYSMKLLGENYLKGKVGFSSDDTTKTIFYIDFSLP